MFRVRSRRKSLFILTAISFLVALYTIFRRHSPELTSHQEKRRPARLSFEAASVIEDPSKTLAFEVNQIPSLVYSTPTALVTVATNSSSAKLKSCVGFEDCKDSSQINSSTKTTTRPQDKKKLPVADNQSKKNSIIDPPKKLYRNRHYLKHKLNNIQNKIINRHIHGVSMDLLKNMSLQDIQLFYKDQVAKGMPINELSQYLKSFNNNTAIDPNNPFDDVAKNKVCDSKCRLSRAIAAKRSGGYASRVLVENVTLPLNWTMTEEQNATLLARKEHVTKVCHENNLDVLSSTNLPNAWEILLNKKYNLLWCNVFKVASSTWFYNFNLLAGYTESQLLHARDTPITIARKKYPRLTVNELQSAMKSIPKPLAFMIARHPLERLVSAFRDKMLSGSRYYNKLYRTILGKYPNLGTSEQKQQAQKEYLAVQKLKNPSRKRLPPVTVPSFPQFVQFVIDSDKEGVHLDEHWAPIYKFCSPCLIDYDVFAKIETLDEDSNYIIFSQGLQHILKPKRINRARNAPTNAVADQYLCQLSKDQMKELINLYLYDMKLFEYGYDKYLECTKNNR